MAERLEQLEKRFTEEWDNICIYAEKGCIGALNDWYFRRHCMNNGERCYVKSRKASKGLVANKDL